MKLKTTLLLFFFALTSLFAADDKTTKKVEITDAQRLEIRTAERDYYRFQAQMAQLQAQATDISGKMDASGKSLQAQFQAMGATCSDKEQLDPTTLHCSPKPAETKAEAAPVKPGDVAKAKQ